MKPSYQNLTSCFFSERPYSSNARNTSSSVNPKQSAYFSEVVVTTSRLFKSEKNEFLAHACNTSHNCACQIRIRLKCRVKETSDKSRKVIPESIHKSLLQGRIIFIQQNDHFFAIISGQKSRKLIERNRRSRIVHVAGNSAKIVPFLFSQKISFQQKRFCE